MKPKLKKMTPALGVLLVGMLIGTVVAFVILSNTIQQQTQLGLSSDSLELTLVNPLPDTIFKSVTYFTTVDVVKVSPAISSYYLAVEIDGAVEDIALDGEMSMVFDITLENSTIVHYGSSDMVREIISGNYHATILDDVSFDNGWTTSSIAIGIHWTALCPDSESYTVTIYAHDGS